MTKHPTPRSESGEQIHPLLSVKNLSVVFGEGSSKVLAVEGVSFDVMPGEIVGIAGESGSGKTAATLSVGKLLPASATVTGTALFQGIDLLSASDVALRRVRGLHVGYVFQDSLTSLNPLQRIGKQLRAVLDAHGQGTRRERRQRVLKALETVSLSPADRIARLYPHELSGGMRQRAMIARAMINGPSLIIADEPTTALDATVQAQVLDLIVEACRAEGISAILISHDLGVMRHYTEKLAIMYAGRLVEFGLTSAVLGSPRHPYTAALLKTHPRPSGTVEDLVPISGETPQLSVSEERCYFAPRCEVSRGRELCVTERPQLSDGAHRAACHFSSEVSLDVSSLG